MIKKPMLACSENVTEHDLQNLSYPLYVTPKVDGIRMLTMTKPFQKVEGYSRKLIRIRNTFIQEWVENTGIVGLDGDIILPGGEFNDVQSFAMSEFTLPKEWMYYVFDYHAAPHGEDYLHRMQRLKFVVNHFGNKRIKLLYPTRCDTPTQVARFFKAIIAEDSKWCDGIILRSPSSPYKEGRSTMNEGFMLKMKPYEDAEAIIIGFEPELENLNEQTKDNTGAAKRSSHKANKKAKETLGRFIVRTGEGDTFSIGASTLHSEKEKIWNNRSEYMGLTLTYKHLPTGRKDKPRTPIFKGIRYD